MFSSLNYTSSLKWVANNSLISDSQIPNICQLNMQSQIEQLQAARMMEIETHVQEEMAKLSATLQVWLKLNVPHSILMYIPGRKRERVS